MAQQPELPYIIRRMEPRDISQVLLVDQKVFKDPWPKSVYIHELYFNVYARYFVLQVKSLLQFSPYWPWERQPLEKVHGFVGMRVQSGEGHISTLGVHPQWRGYGFGELLLITALEQALIMNAQNVALEVRVSNTTAQSLYHKYEFVLLSSLPGYYQDGEDAFLLQLHLEGRYPDYRRKLEAQRQDLERRCLEQSLVGRAS